MRIGSISCAAPDYCSRNSCYTKRHANSNVSFQMISSSPPFLSILIYDLFKDGSQKAVSKIIEATSDFGHCVRKDIRNAAVKWKEEYEEFCRQERECIN